MKELFFGFLLWLATLFGFDIAPESNIDTQPVLKMNIDAPPVLPAGQSAPAGAASICLKKNHGDTCSFSYKEQSIQGICQSSGTILACTPQLPNL